MEQFEKKKKKSVYRDIIIPNFATMEEYQDFLYNFYLEPI